MNILLKGREFYEYCNRVFKRLRHILCRNPRWKPTQGAPVSAPWPSIMVKVYITTNNQKDVFKQMQANARVEICALAADGRWMRISADAVADPDRQAKVKMLDENPALSSMYNLDDGIFEVLYLENAKAVISSFHRTAGNP